MSLDVSSCMVSGGVIRVAKEQKIIHRNHRASRFFSVLGMYSLRGVAIETDVSEIQFQRWMWSL
ncbi:MAG: hypothetical protein K2W95_23105, partial [Candidatus Obscuribacterales bacterium]|nr:hypothetical protein [Candidatus Obscuribacterales bacterium]